MTTDTRSSRQIEVLRELGLSRAESEVYLACLQLAAGGGGLLSSYRVAQEMGRDPANVGKVVNTLAHLQALRVVQEKPRLFVPVPPAEFTDRLLDRMQRRGAEALSLLEDFGAPEAEGIAQALAGRDQVLARAQRLLAACRRDLLVAGSPEMVRELGADLERVAETPGCRVRVVSPQAFSSAVVEVSALPTAGRLDEDHNEGWLMLTCDDTSWLVALLPHEAASASGPCGWWAAGSPVARVWSDFLETSWRAGVRVGAGDATTAAAPQPTADEPGARSETAASGAPAAAPAARTDPGPVRPPVLPEFERLPAAGVATPAPAATPSGQPAAAVRADESPAGSPSPETRSLSADEAEKAGFSFLFKHDRKPGRGAR